MDKSLWLLSDVHNAQQVFYVVTLDCKYRNDKIECLKLNI